MIIWTLHPGTLLPELYNSLKLKLQVSFKVEMDLKIETFTVHLEIN